MNKPFGRQDIRHRILVNGDVYLDDLKHNEVQRFYNLTVADLKDGEQATVQQFNYVLDWSDRTFKDVTAAYN
jgi:hypothetical protein